VSFATLEGVAVTAGSVQVPGWGCPWASVDLAEGEALTGSVSLVLADKTLVGTVVAGGADNGRAAYVIVGGAGGWGQEIAAKPYHTDTGVKLATVIGDAARAVGETVEGVPTGRTGPHYARALGAASDVLNVLTPEAWYVDFDGVTRFGARATTAYTGDGARTRNALAAGVFDIVTDVIGDLVPGVTIDDSLPATDVEYHVGGKSLTVCVFTAAQRSRRAAAWRRLILALFPELRYAGTFEYRVVTLSGERVNLQPIRTGSGMPNLARVPVRPGVAGMKSTITLGSHVLVTFADRDPSRPQCFAHDAPDAPGFGVSPAVPIARFGDAVVANAVAASPGFPTVVYSR
jgi:hypothetical protein